MPAREVIIRMYRQGLGDCFLLSFPKGAKRFYMLIDCGAFVSSFYKPEDIKQYVADIKQTTGGKLDVVVGTHEHWDHISGFSDAKDVFDKFDVDQVWVAWTEEPGNPAAAVLRKEFETKKQAVALALSRLPEAKKNKALGLYRTVITDLFGFFGDDGRLGAKAALGKTAEAWKYLLGLGHNVYCDPKRATPLELDGVSGVRVYVLGPPEDPAAVRKKESKAETYQESKPSLTLTDAFLAAVDDDPALHDVRERAFPFDERHRRSAAQARATPFFAGRYGFGKDDPSAWRRIDDEWLTTAGALALDLDTYTNNTCLAFAIELGDGGDVLLFPGDAQVGNWLSWGARTWEVKDAQGKKRTVTFDDLLARTVFYKVGHHGSNNATLRGKGLEKMGSADLVTMIPVHRDTAKQRKWDFPYQPLWDRLKEKARCRVLLADAKDMNEIKSEVQKKLSAAEWKRFAKATKFEPLFVEHRIAY